MLPSLFYFYKNRKDVWKTLLTVMEEGNGVNKKKQWIGGSRSIQCPAALNLENHIFITLK
jgi:hypothetical protein